MLSEMFVFRFLVYKQKFVPMVSSTLKIYNSTATLFMASWKSWVRNLRTLLLQLCTTSPYSVTCHLLHVRVNLPWRGENLLKWVMNIRKGRKTQATKSLVTKSYRLQKSKVRNSDQKKKKSITHYFWTNLQISSCNRSKVDSIFV